MLHTLFECLPITPRPRWDRDGGIWYVTQGAATYVPPDRVSDVPPTSMYRYKPTINSICEPLLGTSVRDRAGVIRGVRYPALAERCRIYREGLEVVYVFRDYEDLFTLAMYRRQVAESGMVLDQLFLALAHAASLRPEQWQELAIRMPQGTPVHDVCVKQSQCAVAIAAE